MNIIDLLYCKYIGVNLKLVGNKRIGFTNHISTEFLLNIIVTCLSVLLSIIVMEFYKPDILVYILIIVSLPFILNIWLHIYLKRKMRKTRIVFNKKYMQSRWGVFWAIMMPILSLAFMIGCVYLITNI